jgi:excinuclease ABC subunit A
VIEHDMRVNARSDWVIDFGPEAEDEGGSVVTEGKPRCQSCLQQNRTFSRRGTF